MVYLIALIIIPEDKERLDTYKHVVDNVMKKPLTAVELGVLVL